MSPVWIGTAGWSIATHLKALFPTDGSHLERYARRFNTVEINSSFYRPHRRSTYERWAASVPPTFRFSVKLPKAITHQARLVDTDEMIGAFADEVSGLGDALGVILIQLPPSLPFDRAIVRQFFAACRARVAVPLVCEPRHPSWFTAEADALLTSEQVGRVAADPSPVPGGHDPGGWLGIIYMRLHGSPTIYRSSYADRIAAIAAGLEQRPAETWCIFDNTAAMAAIPDAIALAALLD